MDTLANLVELDLSCNQIAEISGIETCQHLQKLILRQNRITAVDNLVSLQKLEHLLLQGNPIATIESLNLQQLCKLQRLSTLYLKNVNGTEVLEQILLLQSVAPEPEAVSPGSSTAEQCFCRRVTAAMQKTINDQCSQLFRD